MNVLCHIRQDMYGDLVGGSVQPFYLKNINNIICVIYLAFRISCNAFAMAAEGSRQSHLFSKITNRFLMLLTNFNNLKEMFCPFICTIMMQTKPNS